MTRVMKDWFQYGLGALFVIGYFVSLAFVLTRTVPTENARLVDILFAILSTSMVSILNYFFGTSKSSSDKNEMISNKVNGTITP